MLEKIRSLKVDNNKMRTKIFTHFNTLSSNLGTLSLDLETSKLETQIKFDELQQITTQNNTQSNMR